MVVNVSKKSFVIKILVPLQKKGIKTIEFPILEPDDIFNAFIIVFPLICICT